MKLNQRGVAPILILVAIIGIVAFFAISGSAPFKNNLLTSLFPKDESHAASGFINTNTFVENFDQGAPKNPDGTYAAHAPVQWKPADWYVAIEGLEDNGGDTFPLRAPLPGAQHGSDCTPPPAIHNIGNYALNSLEDAMFLCRDHMMTSFYSEANGYIYFTPPALLDWSNGTAILSYDVNTDRLSGRDWYEVNIAPMQYLNPVQVNGSSGRQMIRFKFSDNVGPNACFFAEYFIEPGQNVSLQGNKGVHCMKESPIQPSFTTRLTFQVKISRNHIAWVVPAGETNPDGTLVNGGKEWVIYEQDYNFPFTSATVMLGQGSYNPDKACADGAERNCANTWHWDNISVSPAIPFTILNPNKRRFTPNLGDTAVFSKPIPQNSFLKFTAWEDTQFSIDNGATWINAQRIPANNVWEFPEHPEPFYTAIPAGATAVKFKWASNAYRKAVKDVAIFSATPPGPTSTPSPTPSPSVSPTPAASVKPGDIDGNGKVDIFDFNIVLTNFGKTGTNIPGDLDHNDKVDIFDFNTLLTNFGK